MQGEKGDKGDCKDDYRGKNTTEEEDEQNVKDVFKGGHNRGGEDKKAA